MFECPWSSDPQWSHPASRPQISSIHWWLSNLYFQLDLSSELQTPVSVLTVSVGCLTGTSNLTHPPWARYCPLRTQLALLTIFCISAKVSFPFYLQRPQNLGIILDLSLVLSKSRQLCLQNIIKRCSFLPIGTAFKLPSFLARILLTLNWSPLFCPCLPSVYSHTVSIVMILKCKSY